VNKYLTVFIFLVIASVCRFALAGQYPLDNFTEDAHRGIGGQASVSVDRENAKFGLGCLAVEYDLSKADRADIHFDTRGRELGKIEFWLRGDGSSNNARLAWRAFKFDANGNPRDVSGECAIDVKLDFIEWRQFSVRPPDNAEKGALVRFVLLQVSKPQDSKQPAGTVLLDEMTVDSPASRLPGSVMLAAPKRLDGSADRVWLALDVRNYSPNDKAACTLQARLLDSRGNRISELRQQWDAPPGSSQEKQFAFDAKLEGFIPPLEFNCQFVAAALNSDISISRKIPMPTSQDVLDDFSNVTDLWRGGGALLEQYLETSEQPVYRFDVQTALSRVAGDGPAGPFALEWRYDLSNGGRDDVFYAQFMPGAPISMSLWVKGDGSGNRIVAGVRDWGRRVRGGGNYSRYYELPLGTLDFIDWRQFTVTLPGEGMGAYDSMGPGNTDYPLELSGLSVRTGGKDFPASGTIRVGMITLANQVKSSDAIAVRIAGKQDDGLYRAGADAATITAFNALLSRPRKMRLTWSLRGRDDAELAKGSEDFDLAPVSHKSFAAAFPNATPVIAAAAPITLNAVVRDVDDAAATAGADAVFSIPNAVTTWDFDTRREYTGGFQPATNMPGNVMADLPGPIIGPVEEPGAKRKALPLRWSTSRRGSPRQRNSPGDLASALSAITIDRALPGLPVKLSVDVFGDGSGVAFYPVFCGKGTEPHDTYQNNVNTLTGEVRIDFTGWRRLEFLAPLVHNLWKTDNAYNRHRPTYPLNLCLVAAADDTTKGESGQLLIDDLRVETQLPPPECLRMSLAADDASDFLAPSAPVRVRLENLSLAGPRKLNVDAVLSGPDGTEIARVQRQVDVPPGGQAMLPLVEKGLPRGGYWLAAAAEDAIARAALYRPIVVMAPGDLEPNATWPESFAAVQTASWPEVIIRADVLRRAVGEGRELVNLDWDLLENRPEQFDFDSVVNRLKSLRAAGFRTRMFLGFAAHWASGDGMELRQRGAYWRNTRHVGYTPDFWHVPEDIADWDNYVQRLMREAGELVDVWSFWDNPDVPGLLELPPERAVAMLKCVRTWQRRYSPQSQVLLAGLNVGTTVGYLKALHDAGGDDLYDIVNVKVNPGVLPPEVWGLCEYLLGLQAAAPGKDVLISEMDWPVEGDRDSRGNRSVRGDNDGRPQPDGSGFNAIGQARNVARMALLCHWMGIRQPILRLSNTDHYPTGTGLAYRLDLGISGARHTTRYMVPRPAYLALMTVRRWLGDLKPYARVEVDDLSPSNTHVLVYSTPKGSAAVLWRVEGSAALELPDAMKPSEAFNAYGTPATPEGRTVRVSQTPVMLAFDGQPAEAVHLALLAASFHPGETEEKEMAMRQTDCLLPAAKPSADAHRYQAKGSIQPLKVRGIIPAQGVVEMDGLAGIEQESFELACPPASDMVLRKRFQLAGKGFKAEVIVNGKPAGTLDLAHTRAELQGGPRDAHFIIPRSLLAADGRQKIELRYDSPANSLGYRAFSLKARAIPLGQLSPVYAAQAVGEMRLDRNVVGDDLKVMTTAYRRGIGTHAWSVIEYPLNGQYASFSTLAGVDACSDGRGTVKFEILGDGRTLSGTVADPETGQKREVLGKTDLVSGLADARRMTVDVTGVNRLTLVVHDADDGNKADAADWLEPVLECKLAQ